LLESENHPYANGTKYGEGPNWRWRVIRVGLKRVGLDEDLIRHGIAREIYAMPLADNFKKYLCGEESMVIIDRPTVSDIAEAALERWVLPRASRKPEYREFGRNQILEMIQTNLPDN
jgi:hypothetical protein